MAIKFDAARMLEIKNRLEEIGEQLGTSIANVNSSMETISKNITGDLVISVLSSYSDNNNTILTNTKTQLGELNAYLTGKIGSYTAVEQNASESLTKVNDILSGIE